MHYDEKRFFCCFLLLIRVIFFQRQSLGTYECQVNSLLKDGFVVAFCYLYVFLYDARSQWNRKSAKHSVWWSLVSAVENKFFFSCKKYVNRKENGFEQFSVVLDRRNMFFRNLKKNSVLKHNVRAMAFTSSRY